MVTLAYRLWYGSGHSDAWKLLLALVQDPISARHVLLCFLSGPELPDFDTLNFVRCILELTACQSMDLWIIKGTLLGADLEERSQLQGQVMLKNDRLGGTQAS